MDAAAPAVSRLWEPTSARTAKIGRLHAVLAAPGATDLDGLVLDQGRIGVGPVVPGLDAPTAWHGARTALRLAVPGERHRDSIVHWDDLGAMSVLVDDLGPKDIEKVADVGALDQIASARGGADTLGILDALCLTDSVRRAAAAVYRHHSTAAAHIRHAETVLGFSQITRGWAVDPVLSEARLLLEPGRFLVGHAGAYIGGVHHVLRPALVGQDHRIRALGTRGEARGGGRMVPVTVAGPLCSGLDVFSQAAIMTPPEVGDLVAVLDVGAYGFTESMPLFRSHPIPAEVAVRGGRAALIRPRQDPGEWLDRQIAPVW